MMASVSLIRENVVVVTFSRQCLDGYLEWYYIVSYTLIIPHSLVDPLDVAENLEDIPPSPPQSGMHDRQIL